MNTDRILETIGSAIRHPAADPELTALLAAIAVLALAIIVVLLLMLVPRRKRQVRKVVRRWVPDQSTEPVQGVEQREDKEPVGEPAARTPVLATAPPPATSAPQPKRRRGRAASLATALAIPVLIVAAFASAYVITGTDRACRACHGDSPAVRALDAGDHLGRASCADCHEQGTGADLVASVVSRTEMALDRSGLTTGTVDARPVSSRACSRCHDVASGVLESQRVNIRVSHAEPLEAGMACADCHGSVGHLGEAGRTPISMDLCLGCHDGLSAPAECSVCHTTDIASVGRDSLLRESGKIAGSGRYQYPPVIVANTDCYGCHQPETQCDPCHGIRLPHPDRFVQGYHAKDAAFEKKQACYRCHETRDCQACHAPFTTGHATNWKSDHARSPWDAGCGCHGRDTNEDIPICVFCHDNAPTQKVGR